MQALAAFRFPLTVALSFLVNGTLFWGLWTMTNGVFEAQTISAKSIEFTRLRRDSETASRREEQITERPRMLDTPEVPNIQIASTNVDTHLGYVPVSIDVGGALKNMSIAVGTDRDIIPMVRIPPVYPRTAKLAKVEGYVTMEVVIRPDGTVEDIAIVEAEPPRLFDTAAVNAMKMWRFKPKIVNGLAVSQRAHQTIEFKLSM